MKKIPLGAEIRIYKNPYGTEYDRISIRVKNESRPEYDKVFDFDAYDLDTTEKAIAVALKNFGQAALESEKGNGEIREVKPLTNADHIRSMTDEELAEFLIDLADDGNLRIRDWLQQPVEEDDHA